MENLGRANLLNSRGDRKSQSAGADVGIEILRNLYSALDSVLFMAETGGLRHNIAQGIDFYDEVRDFEIGLIKQALRETNGSQVRAAALLGLSPTTLHAKIKHYSIDAREPKRLSGLVGGLRVANE